MSEYSATVAWFQFVCASYPGCQSFGSKASAFRARAVRRPDAPSSNLTVEEVFQAYYDCRQRKRNSVNALRFEQRLERNLMDLYHDLSDGHYAPGRSLCFVVLHPKPREIWAADFRDRVVHHILYNRIAERFYRAFIHDTFACIPGRGTLAAANRLRHHLRAQTQNFTRPAHYLQADLANFFVSIDKGVLDHLLAARIDDPWTLDLCRRILHHDPREQVEVRSAPELMRRIPPHKSLFNAGGNGLPIGNLTSQFFANVYLDPLDQFAKRELKWRRYVRYVDDICVVSEDGAPLRDDFARLSRFASDRLRVHFHPNKTSSNTVAHGINFVGYVLRPHACYLRRATVAGAHQRLREGRENLPQRLNSYLGMLRHVNGWRQRQALARHALTHGIHLNRARTKVVTCAI